MYTQILKVLRRKRCRTFLYKRTKILKKVIIIYMMTVHDSITLKCNEADGKQIQG